MKYLSLFSGIGGFELGIQQAYEADIHRFPRESEEGDGASEAPEPSSQTASEGLQRQGDKPDNLGGGDTGSLSCIGFSEIDKYAVQIYQSHFPNHKNYGDITKINTSELPAFDLLVGGFPCQAFSIAGKRKGFDDTRGTLFFEIARILRDKQPRLFLLENVKGLLSHDNGRTFSTIVSTLGELGYDLQWQVLNSKNFGVPQNRERVFIVGHLRGTSRPQVFPIGESSGVVVGEGEEYATANTLTANYWKGPAQSRPIVQVNQPKHSNDRVYSPEGIAPTLNTMQGGNRQPFVAELPRIRKLTPTECERLQGFPDGWTEGVSDTQRYKTLGNAVTVNVIKEIMSRLLWK